MKRLRHFSPDLLAVSLLALAVYYPSHSLAQTYTESVLYSFPKGAKSSPYQEASNLVMDSAGNLYGSTIVGGPNNADGCNGGCGTIFEFSAKGKFSTLYSFTGGSDGCYPSDLTIDKSGNLYGTTGLGGYYSCFGGEDGYGTVFKFATTTKKFSTLHVFGNMPDAENPNPWPLTMDSAGDIFGTAPNGGADGEGAIFEVTAQGVESVIYSFGSVTGIPLGNVLRNNKGDFYGLSYDGLFEVNSNGVASILNSGLGVNSGLGASGYLSRDAAGNYYGLFFYETGTYPSNFYDAGLWEVLSSDNALSTYYFVSDCAEPCSSGLWDLSGPFADETGVMYGASGTGGANEGGAVYEFEESSGTETLIYSFCSKSKCTDGQMPGSGILADSKGNLYGTTYEGGADGYGTIFKLTKN